MSISIHASPAAVVVSIIGIEQITWIFQRRFLGQSGTPRRENERYDG
jgi:hypothetical protein